MTTRYRVEYALKSHRRDQLIEWIKGLLAVPFVLHSHPPIDDEEHSRSILSVAVDTHQRYREIMRDVEKFIKEHIEHERTNAPGKSKLKLLVPSVGSFYTQLPLEDAFRYQDGHRYISRRRFVAPSFNDVRLILNTAQVLGALRSGGFDLVTFDGDVTLYEDGACLAEDNPVIPRIIRLLQRDCKVGIVTAAGYADAPRYYTRLKGLLDAIHQSPLLSASQKSSIVVMGGESNFLFRYDADEPVRLAYVPRDEWLLDEMVSWHEEDIKKLLDIAESSLSSCASNLNMPVTVLRKDRAVGVYPTDNTRPVGREQLEETVLVVQNTLERSSVGSRLPFSAFNGGNDVFVDIGDKSWGVRACQQYFGGLHRSKTLHVGDQFLSAGANDFKARLASTTAWIASPIETVELLDEIDEYERSMHKTNGS